jgi:ferrous iron transport protein A
MLMQTESTQHTFPLGLASEFEKVKIVSVHGGKVLTKRLASMGLVEDTEIQVLQKEHGSGVVVLCGETRLALGMGMAHKISVILVR